MTPCLNVRKDPQQSRLELAWGGEKNRFKQIYR